MAKPQPTARINLKDAVILVFDANPQSMSILVQVLVGFGAKKLLKAPTFAQAQALAKVETIDLVICEGAAEGEEFDGYDFVHWLRRSELDPNAFSPVILTSAHTSLRNVVRSRDCGANFLVIKPLLPTVLLERIIWVARDKRPFVNCPAYIGPDRRFKNDGPPGGHGRRSTDLSGHVGVASEPNMSQEQIDSLMMPKRAIV
jgi:DNA-binding response OmpR family regulator